MAPKHKIQAAARARAGRATQRIPRPPKPCNSDPAPVMDNVMHTENCGSSGPPISIESESEYECGYTGGVNCLFLSDEEYMPSVESEAGCSDTESLSELEGDSLELNLQELCKDLESLQIPSRYKQIMVKNSMKDWKNAEKNRSLGYTGTSQHTKQQNKKRAHKQAELCNNTKMSSDPQVVMMQKIFSQHQNPLKKASLNTPASRSTTRSSKINESGPNLNFSHDSLVNYLSDLSSDEDDVETSGDDADIEDEDDTASSSRIPATQAHSRKQRKLDVAYCDQRKQKHDNKMLELGKALLDIEKLLESKKTKFVAGPQGLQARQSLAIQSHLRLVVKNGRFSIDASERAAESHGFAAKWGGRQLRSWTRRWTETRDLPVSMKGRHAKVYSLLSDPAVAAELRAYVRSNKWAMNPEKLAQFSKNQLLPTASDKYLHHILHEEMPRGLKKYMECELFPRIHLKVGRGISLSTARRWLHLEGFRYISHKKGLYFDGHDCPDVVAYRQDKFLPAMKKYERRLVRYVVGDVETERIEPTNYVERRLVLVAHDEMTAQSNDTNAKSWVLEDQHQLKKKGVGCGLHKSDVICSTIGWLEVASQTLEYGKNYEGYWTGELFVKQLHEKIIPAFEKAHGASYQALIMVDNSQGHSAYSEDALVVSRMNVKPGGKQARMRDGWYIRDGQKIVQPMNYPPDHAEFPNEPKGIKAVLTERGLYRARLRGKCKSKCPADATDCCGKRILEGQDNFKQQKSLVQEVIEAAGHLCIFLPNFHCELNFIEFFWGSVKKYLRDNCDYTFDTLKENMPKALASVQLRTIRLWEHRMQRWMEAYRSGLLTCNAQTQVKKFSSTIYKSHRRVPETLACILDRD